eukprot:Sspe_Gene.35924::Locus_17397_Transcript_1_1_Confidence_1.000_Length_2653::g.35924::m.35924
MRVSNFVVPRLLVWMGVFLALRCPVWGVHTHTKDYTMSFLAHQYLPRTPRWTADVKRCWGVMWGHAAVARRIVTLLPRAARGAGSWVQSGATWQSTMRSVSNYKDKEGRSRPVLINDHSPHPYKLYKGILSDGGELSPKAVLSLLRECHRRLRGKLFLTASTAPNFSGEVTCTSKLFERAKGDLTGEHLAVLYRSFFGYLCKVKEVIRVPQLRQEMLEHGISLSLTNYAQAITLFSSRSAHDSLEYYAGLRQLLLEANVQEVSEPLYQIYSAMISVSALEQREDMAVTFFSLARECRGAYYNRVSDKDVLKRFFPPAWQNRSSEHVLTMTHESFGREGLPGVHQSLYLGVLRACCTMGNVFAVVEECRKAKMLHEYIFVEAIRKAVRFKDFSNAQLAFRLGKQLPENNSRGRSALWSSWIEAIEVFGTLEDLDAALKEMSEKQVVLSATQATCLCRVVSSLTWEALNKQLDVSKATHLISWVHGYLSQAGTLTRAAQKSLHSASTAANMSMGRVRSSTSLGEADVDPASLQRELRWERTQSAAAAAEGVVNASEGEESVPPWEGVIAALRSQSTTDVVAFYVSTDERTFPMYAELISHPFDLTMKVISEKRLSKHQMFSSAGDAGVAVLIQVARLRLLKVSVVALTGDFQKLFNSETIQTLQLFRMAGECGVAGKWSWKALRAYEDEAEGILVDK